MWSCPSAELAEKLIDFMLSVPGKAKKNGQSYVVSARAGTTHAPFAGRPSRAQGELACTMQVSFSLGSMAL